MSLENIESKKLLLTSVEKNTSEHSPLVLQQWAFLLQGAGCSVSALISVAL
jgi:hypothetical protein